MGEGSGADSLASPLPRSRADAVAEIGFIGEGSGADSLAGPLLRSRADAVAGLVVDAPLREGHPVPKTQQTTSSPQPLRTNRWPTVAINNFILLIDCWSFKLLALLPVGWTKHILPVSSKYSSSPQTALFLLFDLDFLLGRRSGRAIRGKGG